MIPSQHTLNEQCNKTSKPLCEIKEENYSKNNSLVNQPLDNSSLLAPLKAPKSYGTYSKQQQEEVIAFIKDGNSLRTAEKVFGIPKSTMHCWLKKVHNTEPVNSAPTDQLIDINADSKFTYPTADDFPGSKFKPLKDTVPQKSSPSQIVIEESELIRFLQTNEGVEMISKAFSVTVRDFLDFVHRAKNRNQENLKGLLLSPGPARPVEVIGFLPHKKNNDVKENSKYCQPVSPNCERKRNLVSDNLTSNKFGLPASVLQKKIKIEQNLHENDIKKEPLTGKSFLASLLSKTTSKEEIDEKPQTMPTKLVLTTKQFLAANKVINSVQPNLVNTYLSPKPLTITNDMLNSQAMCNITAEPSELTLNYSKITNPVSIKAERLESEITLPPDIGSTTGEIDCPSTLNPVLSSITQPTVTSNNTATLNLNEINRTQSERELMALVDGDNVSADELCAEFKETLELSNWVDNENWYMDQYLQHFQVSPAITSPASSLPDNEDIDDIDVGDNTGLTFACDKEKGNKFSFPDTDSSIPLFAPSPSTIDEEWTAIGSSCFQETALDYTLSNYNEQKEDLPAVLRGTKFQSAFYRANKTYDKSVMSAFTKSVK